MEQTKTIYYYNIESHKYAAAQDYARLMASEAQRAMRVPGTGRVLTKSKYPQV
ncbi:hypothetical protein Plhal304r1_c039g0115791 [Plasmopara halstedii]